MITAAGAMAATTSAVWLQAVPQMSPAAARVTVSAASGRSPDW
ncbi:hypothetical protein [Streptomyces sp. NPDC058869]